MDHNFEIPQPPGAPAVAAPTPPPPPTVAPMVAPPGRFMPPPPPPSLNNLPGAPVVVDSGPQVDQSGLDGNGGGSLDISILANDSPKPPHGSTATKNRAFQTKAGRGIPPTSANVGVEFVVTNEENMRLDKIAAVLGVPKRKMLGDMIHAMLQANKTYYDAIEQQYVSNGTILPSVRNKGLMQSSKPNKRTGYAAASLDASLSVEQRRASLNANIESARERAAAILARRRL